MRLGSQEGEDRAGGINLFPKGKEPCIIIGIPWALATYIKLHREILRHVFTHLILLLKTHFLHFHFDICSTGGIWQFNVPIRTVNDIYFTSVRCGLGSQEFN